MTNIKTKPKYSNQIGVIRKLRGVSRKQLARILGHCNTTQICLWEMGYKNPSLENSLKLAIALNVRPDQLFRQMIWKLESELKPKLAGLNYEH